MSARTKDPHAAVRTCPCCHASWTVPVEHCPECGFRGQTDAPPAMTVGEALRVLREAGVTAAAFERLISADGNGPTSREEQPRDADGDPICAECAMPEPSEWCWQQSVKCPFGKPARSQP